MVCVSCIPSIDLRPRFFRHINIIIIIIIIVNICDQRKLKGQGEEHWRVEHVRWSGGWQVTFILRESESLHSIFSFIFFALRSL